MKNIIFLLAFLCLGMNWKGVIVHHTASNQMSLEECNEWHRMQGWRECGYHFIIQRNNTVTSARSLDQEGAHARGFNQTHIGVAFVANGRAHKEQIENFLKLLENLNSRFGRLEVLPHKAVGNTECPGEIFRQIGTNQ